MAFSSSTIASEEKRIVFVSGKGGVGKSLVAAGLALRESQKGRRVLLAEIGETSYYQDFWGLSGVGHTPIRTPQGFDLALWSGESALREYVLYLLRLERLYRLFFENKVMSALINVAPGLNEIAILGKITSGIRQVGPPLEYDLIIVDSYASGHAMALFQAPKGMMEAIKFGPMGTHSREMERIIQDPKICEYVIVTLLEELPVAETLEFSEQIKREIGVTPKIVANKVFKTPVPDGDLRTIEAAQPEGLGEFARYVRSTHERQVKYREALMKAHDPVVEVPLFFSADPNKLTECTKEALSNP